LDITTELRVVAKFVMIDLHVIFRTLIISVLWCITEWN